MKNFLPTIFLLFSYSTAFSQWNGTWPIWTNSSVGIGTSTPANKLDIRNGNVNISRDNVGSCCAPNGDFTLGLSEATNVNGKTAKIQFHNSSVAEGYLQLGNFSGDLTRNFLFGTHQSQHTRLNIQSGLSGYIGELRFMTSSGINGTYAILGSGSDQKSFALRWKGIGTNNTLLYATDACPNNLYLLSPSLSGTKKVWVNGGVFISNGSSGCDFVFDKGYNLMPLDELESYIKAKHHLPNIVTAAQVAAEGGYDLDILAETLWMKVEELTLYSIELNNRVKELACENEELKAALLQTQKLENKLNELESLISSLSKK